MKSISTYLVLLLFPLFAYSQDVNLYPYKEPAFEDLPLEWIYVPQDTSAIGDSVYVFSVSGNGDTLINEVDHLYDGRRHFFGSTKLLDRHFMYLLNRSVMLSAPSGALITKLDLNTGQVIWTTHFDRRTEETSEIPMGMYLDTIHRELHVFGIYAAEKDYYWGKFTLRKYNPQTGALIYQYKAPFQDLNAPILKDGYIPLGVDKMNYSQTTKSYDYMSKSLGPHFFTRYQLDTAGFLQKAHTADIHTDQYIIYRSPLNATGKDSLYSLIVQANTYNRLQDSFKAKFYLQYYSPELDSLSRYYFTVDSFIGPYSYIVPIYSDSLYKIVHIYRNPLPRIWDSYTILMDNQAHILDTIDFQSTIGLGSDVSLFNITPISRQQDTFLLSGLSYDSSAQKYLTYLLQYKIGNPPKVLQKYTPVPKNVKFIPYKIHQLPGRDYLVKWYMGQDTFTVRFGKVTYLSTNIWTLIKASHFQINRTEDITKYPTKSKLTVNIYPVPTNDILSVDFNHIINGTYRIGNAKGGVVARGPVHHTRAIHIRLPSLPPGIYYLTVQPDRGLAISKTFVITKSND